MRLNETTKGHIVILLTNIIFGINTPIAKDALSAVGPYILTTLRFAGCAVLFWIASFIFKLPEVNKKDIGLLCLAALPGIVFNLFLFILGLSNTTPTNASVIVSMTPIFTMIMAFIFLKEPLTFKKIIGVMCGLSGALILIFTKQSSVTMLAKNNTLGIIFCIISGISYALYLTLFAPLIKRNNPVNIMKWMFLASTIAVIPVTWKHVIAFDYSSLTARTCLEMSYVILMATFVNYMFIPMAQARLRPTTLSMYNYVQPVVTAVISIITAMDVLNVYKITAALLIFSGVYIVTTSRSKKQTSEREKVQKTLREITSK
ncbi:MAG: DMT family transporter [Bacteroidales bacterium]|nr:DMT family transporter [Bacteroidales bacterium]